MRNDSEAVKSAVEEVDHLNGAGMDKALKIWEVDQSKGRHTIRVKLEDNESLDGLTK